MEKYFLAISLILYPQISFKYALVNKKKDKIGNANNQNLKFSSICNICCQNNTRCRLSVCGQGILKLILSVVELEQTGGHDFAPVEAKSI